MYFVVCLVVCIVFSSLSCFVVGFVVMFAAGLFLCTVLSYCDDA